MATWQDYYNWQADELTPVGWDPSSLTLNLYVETLAPYYPDTTYPVYFDPVFDAANPTQPSVFTDLDGGDSTGSGTGTTTVTNTSSRAVPTNGDVGRGVSSGSGVTSKWGISGPPAAISWLIPNFGVAGIGIAGSFAYNPQTGLFCGGVGIGADLGKNVGVGPLPWGTMFNGSSYPGGADQILNGWSLSGGINSPILWGVQGMINSSGAAAGPSLGVPGMSLAFTWSWCVKP
jgi:hypothetical protein